MKYRVIIGLIGASMIMASLSGCDSVKKTSKETELQSIEIEEMALVVESESEVKDEDYKEYKVSGYLTEIHFIDYQERYDMG